MSFILPGGLGQLSAPAPASAWDPANKNSNAVLSNNNKTMSYAGTSSTPAGIVRGTRGFPISSGKKYFEITLGNYNSTQNGTVLGFVNSSYSISAGNYLGDDPNTYSGGMFPYGTGANWLFQVNQSNPGSIAVPPGSGQIVSVHIDTGNGYVWFKVNGINLGNAPTVTPGDIQVSAGVPLFPGASCNYGCTATLNTGGPFTYAPASGFTAWG